MNYTLISQILSGTWYLDRTFAESSGLLVHHLLEGNTSITTQGPNSFVSLVSASSTKKTRTVRYSKYDGFDNAKPNSVAVIKVHDVLMKEDQGCGHIGMATMGNATKSAEDNENILGIVYDFDTPGGSVPGLETFGDIIKGCTKPTIGFVSGMACSAGMWLASCCDEIICSSNHDRVGCIGTMSQLADYTEAYAKKGIIVKNIYSNLSKDKNKLYHDIFKSKEGEENYKKEVLDPLSARFQDEIRANRSNVSEDHLTGKTYFAKDVIGILVDRIGTIDDAINTASGNSQTNTTPFNHKKESETSSHNNQTIVNMKQFKNVNTALNTETLESVDNSASLSEEQLEALDTSLATGFKAQDDLTAERAAHTETQTQLTQANEKIAALNGTPGASSKEVNKDTDTSTENESMEFLAKEDISQFNLL